ncbi:amino acid/polyamine transporter I [Exophiala viscosa]|uniref:amino acid/polyamine transporter I n=1 Tax=Exophiala viscosa TaxID=2486360 RepID=UPI00219A15ED|nr:amino acid/polyamine transporter I [Exophiala viscosa]
MAETHQDKKTGEVVGPSGPNVETLHAVESFEVGTLEESSGDAIDDAMLRAQGYKAAMPRVFSILSSIGLCFSITNSWVGALSNFGQGLRYGGPQVVIFSLIVATFVQWIITLGQYHFVYILAAPKYKRISAFVTGWMSVLAWWIMTCSGLSLCAISATGLAAFMYPSYEPTSWQIWLVYVGMAIFSVIPLFIFPKFLTKLATGSLYLTIIGFAVWFIVLLAMKKESNPGSLMTESGLGSSGWSSGTAWMLGISNAMYCYGGTDAAIHIAEEMHSPGRQIPQAMNLTMLIGFVTCVPIMVVFMFVMKDMDKIMNAGFPAAELLYEATGNRPVTIFLTVWLILIYISCLPPQFVECGRIGWAFARDNGLPFSNYFAHIDEKLAFPVRTTLASVVFTAIYGLLYLASSTAFNSIITSAVLFLNITLALPQAILVIRGRNTHLPRRYVNLGWVGYFCNIFSPLWIIVLTALVCMPPSIPVEVGTMNYTSPILVGLFAIVIGSWFIYGHQFEGPKIDWEMLNATHELAGEGTSKKDKQ